MKLQSNKWRVRVLCHDVSCAGSNDGLTLVVELYLHDEYLLIQISYAYISFHFWYNVILTKVTMLATNSSFDQMFPVVSGCSI